MKQRNKIIKTYSNQENMRNRNDRQLCDASKQQKKASSSFNVPDSSFQATRAESIKFLQNIQQKLRQFYKNSNRKIEAFEAHVKQRIDLQLQNLKEKIKALVDSIFENTQQMVENYIKYQQKQYIYKLLQNRSNVNNQFQKIMKWKEQIRGKNWWKTTGQIISQKQNIQKMVCDFSEDNYQYDLQNWKFNAFKNQDFYRLDNELKQIIQLRN